MYLLRNNSIRSISFEGNTWAYYEELRIKNRVLHNQLCKILKEMQSNNPEQGIGNPEPLRHELSGLWSRRLSEKDRLIYRFDDE